MNTFYTDHMQEMLEMQAELQLRYSGVYPSELSGDERRDYIRTMVLALEDELHEALREAPWKPWSARKGWTLEENNRFKDELVDAWHFMMNLMLVSGMTADELFTLYMKKNSENHRRQDDGYTSTTG